MATGAGPPRRRLDAIIVPTIRPWSLGPAVRLADQVGCALVVLCSTADQAEQAWPECQAHRGGVLVTYVPPLLQPELLGLATFGHPENDIQPSSHVDIARKRNVGLLLSRLSGWQTVMFLDDDVTGMVAAEVTAAAGLTERYQVAGFCITDYPDNSVVCHAHRLAGGPQDVFPGGSAMVLDMASANTMFPPIYNEDWLFLFDAAQRRSVACAGTLWQLAYQPFSDWVRAAREEFGDVIAEGLYRLLHEGGSVADANGPYWRDVLTRRRALIDDIAARLLGQGNDPVIGYALMSLTAARKRLDAINELACLSFVRTWRMDVDAWQSRLTGLPMLGDLASAAKFLELPDLDRCVIA
ncbi:MAG TPA: hypothetical protein VHU92_00385 [Streptosporangiaceae bacterium]|nr:hypothetical protein [Streptosporangiaceae bacterium]